MRISFYARGATKSKAAAHLDSQLRELEGAGVSPKLTALILACGHAHLRALPDDQPEDSTVSVHFFGAHTDAGTDLQISARYTRVEIGATNAAHPGQIA